MNKYARNMSKKNRVRHGNDIASNVFFLFIAIILGAFSLLVLGMLFWAFITSLKSEGDIIYGKNYLGFPNFKDYGIQSIWENFIHVLNNFTFEVDESYYSVFEPYGIYQREVTVTFGDMVLNSLIYSFGGSLFMVFVPAIVAYFLAKYKYRFSKFIYGVALITYIIPIVGNYPAMMSVLRTLGLLDKWIGFFIMKFNFTGMYFFVFYSFFENMPDSYLEAAELDGAGQLRVLFQVALPLAKKMLLSVMLIVFVQLWNDFQTPYLYLHTHPTLAYGIWKMSFESIRGVTSLNFRMASVMTMALPLLILFICLKDRLMTNMTLGGNKE